MATCYITMICDEVWVDRGESAINESCYRPILVESSPAQWCIASQPTLRQKLEHNQHSSYSWTLSPWLTMNNKVCLECWFVFSYFRREWHARDVWHCLVLTYRDINQDIVIKSVLTWCIDHDMSHVTVLSFWYVFTQQGWVSAGHNLIKLIISPLLPLLNAPENKSSPVSLFLPSSIW